jgi:GxxExxY protein
MVLYEAESYRIMGACFEVYNRMGAGFLEAVYQECLEIEFAERAGPALTLGKPGSLGRLSFA